MSNDDTKQKLAQIIRAYFDNRGWGLEATCEAVMKVCEEEVGDEFGSRVDPKSILPGLRSTIPPSGERAVMLSVKSASGGMEKVLLKVQNCEPGCGVRLYIFKDPDTNVEYLGFKML